MRRGETNTSRAEGGGRKWESWCGYSHILGVLFLGFPVFCSCFIESAFFLLFLLFVSRCAWVEANQGMAAWAECLREDAPADPLRVDNLAGDERDDGKSATKKASKLPIWCGKWSCSVKKERAGREGGNDGERKGRGHPGKQSFGQPAGQLWSSQVGCVISSGPLHPSDQRV